MSEKQTSPLKPAEKNVKRGFCVTVRPVCVPYKIKNATSRHMRKKEITMPIDVNIDNFELLPYSQEAEQSVLGGILIDPEIINVVIDYVKADYFYRDVHKQIYSVMLSMFSLGSPIDYVTVLAEIEKSNAFNENENPKLYLARLMELVPSVSNIEDYCKIVTDKYYLRRLVSAARKINETAISREADARLAIETAEQEIFDIRRGSTKGGLTKIDKILTDVYDRLSKMNSTDKKETPYIPTGFSHLDMLITGLNPSDLVLLAARPAVGKSSFALNIGVNAAKHSNKDVAMFCLEMSKEQLVERVLASEAKIDSYKFRKGDIATEKWADLAKAASDLCKINMYFDDTAAITVTEMKSRLRRLPNLGLVIIDYLQLMSSVRRFDNRAQEVSELTRNLKIMAKELDVPILLLSQLSRESEKRREHRPMLSDLRDSGSIEQDADIVMFLYKDVEYNPETENPDQIECIIRKNRHGAIGTINFHFEGKYTLFTSTETRYEE